MVLPPVPPALVALSPFASAEPDGSRTLGIVPPYRAEPAPPRWLRAASHFLAAGADSTRHYIYEAYADGQDGWLVRYLHLPDATEAPAELEQAFLFSSDPLGEPCTLLPGSIRFEKREALCLGRVFVLVDRRDLCAPTRFPAAPRP